MSPNAPRTVFKILAADVPAAGDGQVPLMPIDLEDGFIHLSTAQQLSETLALHFRGQSNLSILAIRTADIHANLRWEPSRGGQLFPHVYGSIPVSAVVNEAKIDVAEDGTVDLPVGFM